jgi:hypothetical protein
MPDIQRRSTRIKLFDSAVIPGGGSYAIISPIWNITPGQAFSLWIESLTSSATVGVAINQYPGLNGTGGDPVVDTLASSAAVGILSASDIALNQNISKAISVTMVNSGSSAAVVTASLLMY